MSLLRYCIWSVNTIQFKYIAILCFNTISCTILSGLLFCVKFWVNIVNFGSVNCKSQNFICTSLPHLPAGYLVWLRDWKLCYTVMHSVNFHIFAARKVRFKAVCQRFGLNTALLPQYNATRWNSWFESVVANYGKLAAIPTFISEECAIKCETPNNIIELKNMIDDQSTWFTVSLSLAFTSTCMKRLSTSLDLFQSRKPQSHLVTGRLDALVNYYSMLSTSSDPTDFGIQSVIQGMKFLN